MKELASSQIIFVCPHALRGNFLDCRFFLRGQYNFERVDNARRDFILNREHVLHLAIVSLGPQLKARCDIDELSRDAKPIARLANASLEYGVNLQLPSDRADVFLVSLERKRRSARRNIERADLRESVDDLFADPVGEKFIL